MEYTFTSLPIATIALIGGLILLVTGGEFLVAGAIALAERLGMPPLLVGLTVVAFGTSMPEFFVSISATSAGHPSIMVGNVIGSNIANIGLILAISALISPLAIHYTKLRTELWAATAASFLLLGCTFLGYVNRFGGLLFASLLILYTWYSYREGQKSEEHMPCETPTSLLKINLFILGGLVLLAYGSGFFIDGAVDLALHLGISELVIGLSIAAVGTSLPELASCISAIRRRKTDILVGNVIGSNLFNILMVMGVTGIIFPFKLDPSLLLRDVPIMLIFTAILIPILYFKHRVSRLTGLCLLCGYGAYMYSLT
ncbi:MAG: calcium/sodium antiporter [Desulfobulbaceae bacterium]|jgi:cation:H+ antiporter|nr:calcium/sodium antiporter [Desulfobulbaceae bacterium]